MLRVKKPVRLKYESVDLSMEDPKIWWFWWLNTEHYIDCVSTLRQWEYGRYIVSFDSFSQLHKIFRNIFSISRLIENPQKIFRCLPAANIYN